MKNKQIIETIRTNLLSKRSNVESNSDIRTKGIMSLILSGASLLLTIFNIVNGYRFMTITTSVLAIGFILCAILYMLLKKLEIADWIMGIMIGYVFSVYAVTGENEGFAILWILLVPSVGMSLIGIAKGGYLSLYFLAFLFIIFYTPINDRISDIYTVTFKARFPVLYLVDMIGSLYLVVQKEYYNSLIEKKAYEDGLTGLKNRRFYEEILETHKNDNDLTIISIDLNKLKYYNDNLGHEAGDELLSNAARIMAKTFEDALAVCRSGGDEFMIVTKASKDKLLQQIETLKKENAAFEGKMVKNISLSLGYARQDENPELNLHDLEKQADTKMYQDKAEYYRQNGNDRRRR